MRRGTQYGPDSDPKDDWRLRAACRDYDPELWFPVSTGPTAGDLAKRVCARCKVSAECLTEATEFGIWGGLDEKERRKAATTYAARLA